MSTASVDPQPNPSLSEAQRWIKIFSDPVTTFRDLQDAPRWWAPWLITAVAGLIFIVVLSQRIGFEQISANQIAMSSRAEQFDKLPADQQQAALARSAAIIRVVSYAFPATLLVSYLLIAAILVGIFNLAMGAQLKFPTMLAVVAYSGLVHLIGTATAIGLLFVPGDPDKYNVSNASGTNIAYFLDPTTTNKFVYTVLSGVDVIVIWGIILMGIGVAANSKVKRRTAILAIAGLYLGWKLLTGALAVAF